MKMGCELSHWKQIITKSQLKRVTKKKEGVQREMVKRGEREGRKGGREEEKMIEMEEEIGKMENENRTIVIRQEEETETSGGIQC